jgi:hypothetical protein
VESVDIFRNSASVVIPEAVLEAEAEAVAEEVAVLQAQALPPGIIEDVAQMTEEGEESIAQAAQEDRAAILEEEAVALVAEEAVAKAQRRRTKKEINKSLINKYKTK